MQSRYSINFDKLNSNKTNMRQLRYVLFKNMNVKKREKKGKKLPKS